MQGNSHLKSNTQGTAGKQDPDENEDQQNP